MNHDRTATSQTSTGYSAYVFSSICCCHIGDNEAAWIDHYVKGEVPIPTPESRPPSDEVCSSKHSPTLYVLFPNMDALNGVTIK